MKLRNRTEFSPTETPLPLVTTKSFPADNLTVTELPADRERIYEMLMLMTDAHAQSQDSPWSAPGRAADVFTPDDDTKIERISREQAHRFNENSSHSLGSRVIALMDDQIVGAMTLREANRESTRVKLLAPPILAFAGRALRKKGFFLPQELGMTYVMDAAVGIEYRHQGVLKRMARTAFESIVLADHPLADRPYFFGSIITPTKTQGAQETRRQIDNLGVKMVGKDIVTIGGLPTERDLFQSDRTIRQMVGAA